MIRPGPCPNQSLWCGSLVRLGYMLNFQNREKKSLGWGMAEEKPGLPHGLRMGEEWFAKRYSGAVNRKINGG